MTQLSALQHLGLGFETTFGTKVIPTFWVPVNSCKPTDDIKKINDEGRRANLSKTFQIYDGIKSGKVDIGIDAYPDAIGYFLKALLGQDTVSGTNPNYTHKFTLVNAMAPSTTLSFFNGVAEHAYAGAYITDLGFKFDTEGVMTLDAKYTGMIGTVVTTTTPVYSTVSPFLGYQSSLTLNSVGDTNLVGGEITLKREVKLLYGANSTQQPSKASTGRVSCTGKLTFDIENEATEYGLFGSADVPIVLTLAQNANTSIAFQFTTPDITKATIDSSQEFVRVDLEFEAYYNSTDAGPCTITLKNQVASY
jgi:hypothetical protein